MARRLRRPPDLKFAAPLAVGSSARPYPNPTRSASSDTHWLTGGPSRFASTAAQRLPVAAAAGRPADRAVAKRRAWSVRQAGSGIEAINLNETSESVPPWHGPGPDHTARPGPARA